jgi:tripartite ATP-independent transporter DctM subunit
MVALVILGLLLALMVLGVPVTIALGVSSLSGLAYIGMADSWEQLYLFPMQILEGVDAPALLAIPFFILAGNLMNAIGVTDKIFALAQAMVGHMRAGLAQVNVIGSLFFGGITGSAVADCAGIGNIAIRSMRERGYPAPYACALTVSASVIGPTMWPSVPLLIYAFSANVSVERIFLAGIGPGALIVLSLMVYNRIVAIRYGVPLEPRQKLAAILQAVTSGAAALVTPLIIVGAILTGFATAVEAGVVACVYTLILGVVFRTLDWAKLKTAVHDSVLLTSAVMMIIGVSTLMGWVVAYEQVPQEIANTVLQATQSKWVFMGAAVVFLLVIGTVLEPIPAMVILIPIFLPLVDQFQIDRVHFGLVVVYGLLLGIVTPPVGVALFIVTKISKVPFEKVCAAVIPFLVPLVAVLLVIAFVPQTVLWLPDLVLGVAQK